MLNDQQLQYLESYCVINGVNYYDLQVEVIDHVAAMIEEIQQENPAVDFKEALHMVNARFNKNDFGLMVNNKKQVLEKRISGLIKKEFISFFTIPRIFLTVLFYCIAYSIPALMQKSNAIGLLGIFVIASPLFYYMVRYWKLIKSFSKNSNSNLLALKVRSRYEIIAQFSFPVIYLVLNFFGMFSGFHFSKTGAVVMPVIFLLVTSGLLYIAIWHVRFAFNDKMKNDYPGAFKNA